MPIVSGGGGGAGGLPHGWTQDADGNIVSAPADALASLSQLHLVAPANANDAWTVTDAAHPANVLGSCDPFGYFAGSGADFGATSDTTPLKVEGAPGTLTSRDMVSLFTNTTVARFNHNGYLLLKKNAAPGDAELNANEVALWFDSTNGAAKFMLKGKTADGTVVTASVAMA